MTIKNDRRLNRNQRRLSFGFFIYKRYLLKYSTKSRIEEALYDYLKNPRQQNSIMPAPFFLKFPMKEPTKMDEKILRKNIRAYIDYFDPRKRLRLEE